MLGQTVDNSYETLTTLIGVVILVLWVIMIVKFFQIASDVRFIRELIRLTRTFVTPMRMKATRRTRGRTISSNSVALASYTRRDSSRRRSSPN